MTEFPDTNESLIVQVKDCDDQAAWERFEKLYRPVIFRIARAKGLQHCDALDLVQQVLLSVSVAIPRYEKQRNGPPFRNWLSRITKNAIIKGLQSSSRGKGTGGTQILDVLREVPSADDETDALIHTEYRREIYAKAAEMVRIDVAEATWLAFEMTVLQNHSVLQAAETLRVSTGSVYAARSRIIRRLRDAVHEIESNNLSKDL